MKNMINTIGKKIHTLVKENTPRRHKIRREWGFTQKFTFSFISLCFLPHCCVNIGREVGLMLPTHTKKYMTPTNALIFQKHVKMCVYIRHIKKPVYFYYTFGEVRAAKKGWAGGHFFRTRVGRVWGA